jgi:hypothetical protein
MKVNNHLFGKNRNGIQAKTKNKLTLLSSDYSIYLKKADRRDF